jgi:hypothetical protein
MNNHNRKSTYLKNGDVIGIKIIEIFYDFQDEKKTIDPTSC